MGFHRRECRCISVQGSTSSDESSLTQKARNIKSIACALPTSLYALRVSARACLIKQNMRSFYYELPGPSFRPRQRRPFTTDRAFSRASTRTRCAKRDFKELEKHPVENGRTEKGEKNHRGTRDTRRARPRFMRDARYFTYKFQLQFYTSQTELPPRCT